LKQVDISDELREALLSAKKADYGKWVGEIVMEKIEAVEKAGKYLLSGEQETAKMLINEQYPFKHMEATGRAYTDKQKMQQFKKDGFIDRYSGQKLVNPGFLKVLSYYMPEENWATTSMLHNSIKNNWTLEQLNWKLYDAGDYEEWDGLTALFVELVNANKSLLEDSYIKRWYRLSC